MDSGFQIAKLVVEAVVAIVGLITKAILSWQTTKEKTETTIRESAQKMANECDIGAQDAGRQVQKQQAGQGSLAELADQGIEAEDLDFGAHPGLIGGAQQGQRRMQHAVGRAADQPFMAMDFARIQIEYRLKQAMQPPVTQDVEQQASHDATFRDVRPGSRG